MQVGEHDLGGGNQEVVARHVIGIVLELGQLAGTEHGLALHHDRRPPLFETAAGMRIDEVVDERTLKAGAGATEHGETTTRELVATVEIKNVEIGA